MNANEYAKIAQELSQIANKIRPETAISAYADIRNIMVYHLRMVARDARLVSEDLAAKEKPRAVNENQDYNTSGS